MSQASRMCCRFPAITWRWSPASCSSRSAPSFALVPAFANRYPIKKWAALAALGMAAFYLLLSGAEVATQRAFIMTAIVLIGVMFDRPALTLRTIAVAALAVMLISPEAVVHPSFQMSFAATLALVAAYERGLPWFSAVPETSLGCTCRIVGRARAVGTGVASLVAGLATTLFAAYHFHRLAPYGVLANLLAMPIVSGWVMPAGLLALVAIPFGFDGLLWRLMGEGIGWMIAVATFVASLPGAVGRIPAFGIGAGARRHRGLDPALPAALTAALVGNALLVLTVFLGAADAIAGRAGLFRWPDRGCARRRWPFARDQNRQRRFRRPGLACGRWRCADGTRSGACLRAPAATSLAVSPVSPDGKLVALSLTAEALAEDCSRAAIVVTARNALAGCAASAIDREVWGRAGAISLKWNGKSFDREAANPPGHLRPWTRSREPAQRPETAAAPVRPAPRDATPRLDDIEPGDQ